MKYFLSAAGFLIEDFAGTILFLAIYQLTHEMMWAAAAGIALSVGQVGWRLSTGRGVDALQWVSLGLVLVTAGASLVTHDPRFVMLKPSVIYLIVGGVMLKRGWMSEPEFFTGLALCQVLPGVNVVNLAVHVGQRLRGVVGAAVCTVGILLAPFFIVIALATIYDQIKDIAWLHAFFEGVAVSAVGLMVSVALRSVRGTFRGIVPYVIALTLIVTVGVLRWPMIPLALTLGPLSVFAAWWIQRRAARGRDA